MKIKKILICSSATALVLTCSVLSIKNMAGMTNAAVRSYPITWNKDTSTFETSSSIYSSTTSKGNQLKISAENCVIPNDALYSLDGDESWITLIDSIQSIATFTIKYSMPSETGGLDIYFNNASESFTGENFNIAYNSETGQQTATYTVSDLDNSQYFSLYYCDGEGIALTVYEISLTYICR